MAKLDVSGSFLITIGHGAGPETWVVISVSSEDGNAKFLSFPDDPNEGPVSISLVLSALFGAHDIPLRIVERQPVMETGFYGLRVEPTSDPEVALEKTRPSTLRIVVNDGTDLGQALACSCGGTDVTSFFGERTQEPRG